MSHINPIKEFYNTNDSLQSTKLAHYFDLYWRYFSHKSTDPNLKILEIGVRSGGSLLCWKNIFPQANIHGFDVNPNCRTHEKYGFNIHIGDQGDESRWDKFNKEVGGLDIIIDDGSHIHNDIIKTFNKLFPKMNSGGVYFIEDVADIKTYEYFTKYVKQSYKPNKPKENDIMGVSFYNKVIVVEKIPTNYSIEAVHSGSISEHELPVGIGNDNWKKKCKEE
jgi:hypothetical protein